MGMGFPLGGWKCPTTDDGDGCTCVEIPTLGVRKEEERLLGDQEAGRPPPWRSQGPA